MNFFKLFIGDYQRDTAHLNLAENGAYLILLQHYYATEKPLPKGTALHRMLRTQNKAERDAVNSVVAQFWTETEEGLINERADREIAKSAVQADANKRIAIAREAARKVAREKHESCSDDSTNRTTNDQPNHSHSHSHSNTIKSGGEALPRDPPVDNSEDPKSPIVQLALQLRARGMPFHNNDPDLRKWLTQGKTPDQILTALATAQQRRAEVCSTQPINAAYLDAILQDPGKPPNGKTKRRYRSELPRHSSVAEIDDAAKTLDVPLAKPGETRDHYLNRINLEIRDHSPKDQA